jgi:hypothetical protein
MVPASLRRWHSYIGLFIAPSVLFFALTGALQIFDFHEAHGTYHPWALIEKLAAVHRDQVFERPHEHDAPPSAPPPAATAPAPTPEPNADSDEDKTGAATLALKWFFFLIALALAGSTSVGIWMGLQQIRPKSRAWALLVVGTLAPVCLLLL